MGGKGSDRNVAKKIKTHGRRSPQITFTILIELVHVVAGETVSTLKVIHLATVNAVNTVVECRNPKSVFSVLEQFLTFEGSTIQFGGHKWLPHALHQLLKSFAGQVHSYPYGAIRVRSNCPYAANSFLRFQFL